MSKQFLNHYLLDPKFSICKISGWQIFGKNNFLGWQILGNTAFLQGKFCDGKFLENDLFYGKFWDDNLLDYNFLDDKFGKG